MSAGVQMLSPQTGNQGLGIKQVLIRSIDAVAGVIYATDTSGNELQLPLRIQRVAIPPAPGQTWLADRALGFWALAAYIASTDGLWGAPAGSYAQSQEQSATSLTQPLTTSAWTIPTTAFLYTNPSPVWQMRVAVWVHARMTCNLTANSGAVLADACQFAGSSTGVRTSYGPLGNPTAATINGLRTSAWNTTETVIAPGATAELNATCTAAAISAATVTLTEWVVWAEFLATLIDPAQPGSVPA